MRSALARFLEGRVLRALVLTGFDRDHADAHGIEHVLRSFLPEWLVYPDYDKDTLAFNEVQRVIAAAAAHRDPHLPLRQLPVNLETMLEKRLDGICVGFSLEVFSPHSEDMTTFNNCSLVMRVRGRPPGGFSYLITGDTENERWETINRLFGHRLAADVMAAPHHGSRNSINGETLLFVRPDTILISAGADNPYGHPDSRALAAYSRVADSVYSTHIDGGCSLFTRRVGSTFQDDSLRLSTKSLEHSGLAPVSFSCVGPTCSARPSTSHKSEPRSARSANLHQSGLGSGPCWARLRADRHHGLRRSRKGCTSPRRSPVP